MRVIPLEPDIGALPSSAGPKVEIVEIHEVRPHVSLRPNISSLTRQHETAAQGVVDARETLQKCSGPLGRDVVREDIQRLEVDEITKLREPIAHDAHSAAEVGGPSARHPGQLRDPPPRGFQIEFCVHDHRGAGELGGLLNGEVVKIHEVAELGERLATCMGDFDGDLDPLGDSDAEIEAHHKTAKVLRLQRELLAHEIEDLARSEGDRVARLHTEGSARGAEEVAFLRRRRDRRESQADHSQDDGACPGAELGRAGPARGHFHWISEFETRVPPEHPIRRQDRVRSPKG